MHYDNKLYRRFHDRVLFQEERAITKPNFVLDIISKFSLILEHGNTLDIVHRQEKLWRFCRKKGIKLKDGYEKTFLSQSK